MKVRNINGTSDNVCKCNSWKQHWLNFSGRTWPNYCSEKSCTLAPTVGAHVQKDSGTSWFIIPLCDKHNSLHGETIEVTDGTIFVSANKSETCEK